MNKPVYSEMMMFYLFRDFVPKEKDPKGLELSVHIPCMLNEALMC